MVVGVFFLYWIFGGFWGWGRSFVDRRFLAMENLWGFSRYLSIEFFLDIWDFFIIRSGIGVCMKEFYNCYKYVCKIKMLLNQSGTFTSKSLIFRRTIILILQI